MSEYHSMNDTLLLHGNINGVSLYSKKRCICFVRKFSEKVQIEYHNGIMSDDHHSLQLISLSGSGESRRRKMY